MAHVDDLVDWAKSIKEYTEQQVVQPKKCWSGFKIVESGTRRKYIDESRIVEIAKEQGITDIYETKLPLITKLDKQVGKNQFNDLFGDLVVKPTGKPTLVPESDYRPAIVNIDTTEEFNQL